MGVDVNLYVTGDVSDEDAVRVNALLLDRCDRFVDDWTGEGVVFSPTDAYDEPRWQVSTMARYYGPGYERGPWAEIAAAIILLRHALPGRTVHYGGDSDDACPVVDDEYLAEIWAHWAGPDGDDYHSHMERREAEMLAHYSQP